MKIEFFKGDITRQTVDAIVNAANSSLMGGSGVDGAIHRAGGPKILEECKAYVAEHGRLPTGQAMMTTGGEMRARFVIHTVGPIYRERQGLTGRSKEEQGLLLKSCYVESLKLAAEKGLKTVAFPSISTGAYHYPLSEAAPIALQAVKEFLRSNDNISEVRFVLFSDEALTAYQNAGKNSKA